MLKIFTLIIALFPLTGCDNHAFTQFFRNPYIVEVGELDTLNADQWYEFKTFAKALNKKQVIRIDFLGSAPSEMDFEVVGFETNGDGPNRFFSTRFPNKDIIFDVSLFSDNGDEFVFYPVGQSSGIRFVNKSDLPMMGKEISLVKIRSNLDLNNIKVTWISSTPK